MSQWKSTIERLPGIFKYLMVAGVVIFISFLFPNNVKFKYQFDRGQTWRYGDLEAPFDFPIRKTAEELEVEKGELAKEISPYYEIQADVLPQQLEKLAASFGSQLEMVQKENQFPDVQRAPSRYLNYGQQLLNNIYTEGVIQLAEEHQSAERDFVINIIRGNTNKKQTLENVFTVASATDLLTDSLPYSRLKEAEFLYPLLENLIQPNLVYNDTLTNKFKNELLTSVSTSRGMVRKGELIINQSGLVTDDVYEKLSSFKAQYEEEISAKQSTLGVFIGYFILTSIIVGVFMLYLQLFSPNIYASFSKLIFILIWLVIYSYLVYAVEQTEILSAYLIPFAIAPIVIKTFYSEQLALFTHIVIVLIASFLSSLGYEFTFLQVLAGIIVILCNVDTKDWSNFFYSMLLIFLGYGLGYFGLSLIQEGTIATIDWSVYPWLFLNVFLTLLAYPLIPLVERFFGFTSSISLIELSDMNRPLLQEIALKAPGTLQHSLQVANLSEAAAQKIGANPLLVKVAALYHDVGKAAKAEFFIENQTGRNPHDEISDLDSAQIIIGHVTEGEKMAKKYRLPSMLIDFIKTHHGTTRVEYFYRNYVKDHPDEEVDESLFRYPGPVPTSKEETILMMADSIEAACKSLKNPTAQDINQLIDKIIAGKIAQGQMEKSTMSFQEMEACKQVFKQVMKSIHHVRIEYPEEKVK